MIPSGKPSISVDESKQSLTALKRACRKEKFMLKRPYLRMLAVLALAVVFLMGNAVSVFAAGEKKAGVFSANFDWDWAYASDSLPSFVSPSYAVNNYIGIGPDKDINVEDATSFSAEFVSGDEALKNAIQVSSHEENGQMLPAYSLDASAPGTAVFHLTAESENYHAETDRVLRVLDWNEHPLFTVKKDDGRVTVKQGERITTDELVSYYLDPHYTEIQKWFTDQGESMPESGFSPWIFFTDTPVYNQMLGLMDDVDNGQPAVCYGEITASGKYEQSWLFREVGEYDATVSISLKSSQYLYVGMKIAVVNYGISGPQTASPGQSLQFTVQDEDPSAGRTFAWSLAGEGASIDEAGQVTVVAEAEPGTVFTITATPSDGSPEVSKTLKVLGGVLDSLDVRPLPLTEGFTMPLFMDDEGSCVFQQTNNNCFIVARSEGNAAQYLLGLEALTGTVEEMLENPEAAMRFLNDWAKEQAEAHGMDYEQQFIEIDGHPALLMTGLVPKNENGNPVYIGYVMYVRNNAFARVCVESLLGQGAVFEDLPPVTMSDLTRLTEVMEYDPSQASVTLEDGQFTITEKEGKNVLTAGKRMQLKVEFSNPDKVNRNAKNDTVEWSVTDPATGEAPEEITIDKNGNLSVKNSLAEVKKVEVKATATYFNIENTYEVTAIPAVKKITAEPAELFFYTGTDASETVKAVLDPDTVPLLGITWTCQKKDFVEITDHEDGTATVRPVGSGRSAITVTEPGGKRFNLNVNIVEPVTEVVLSGKETARPGNSVNVTAALSPRNAGNKTVEWSLDVGEDIATVNERGQIRISKEAPVGTKITVTCIATGAPEPVKSTFLIEVTE